MVGKSQNSEFQMLPLATWARRQGIAYQTAWRWANRGQMPAGSNVRRTPTGMILVRDEEITEDPVDDSSSPSDAIIYVRINPRQKSEEMEDQARLCRDFCAARGWIVKKTVREVAAGLGGKRRKLLELLASKPNRIVISRQSVLSRFDAELLAVCMSNSGCELVVIDESSEAQGTGGALEDLADAISVTCHRHYGLKRGRLLVESLQKIVEKGM